MVLVTVTLRSDCIIQRWKMDHFHTTIIKRTSLDMSHSKHSALGDPHLNARYGTFLWGSIIIVYHIMFNLSCMHATPVSSKEAGEDDTLLVNQADQLNEQMGQSVCRQKERPKLWPRPRLFPQNLTLRSPKRMNPSLQWRKQKILLPLHPKS